MQDERAKRRTLVRVALWLTASTPLAPGLNDRKLLAQFMRGVITPDQLLWLAEERIQTAQAMDKLNQLTAGTMSQEM